MKILTISLPASLKRFVEQQAARKGYFDPSEYIRSLVLEVRARERDIRLETLLVEGLTSGDDLRVAREFWKDLRREAASLARKHKGNP